MDIIPVRHLLDVDDSEIAFEYPNVVNILFEDGIQLSVKNKHIIYSKFFWEIHRVYPNTPMKSTHIVTTVLNGKPLTSNTHLALLNNILIDVVETYHLDTPVKMEHILDMCCSITNTVFNNVSKLAEEYITSIDILDFIDIIDHPAIKNMVDNVKEDVGSIGKLYEGVTKVLYEDPVFKDNNIVKAVKSKMVNINQVLQCVSVRGYITEVDGVYLPKPVLSNYAKGMYTVYDIAADSRSAAKSLYFAESALQDAEYFARRLQILTMTVERIHYTDCGTNDYLEWTVSPPLYDEQNNLIYKGDLPFMTGKYYLDEETHTLKVITHDDKNLHNKKIKLRSSIYCKHEDQHGVCEVCFGALAKNVSPYANLGHLCAATMTQQTSQSILSTKHIDFLNSVTNLVLSDDFSRYFITNTAKNEYLIKPNINDITKLSIVIDRDEVYGLTDILDVDDTDSINPQRISSITYMEMSENINGSSMNIPITLKQGNRKALLSSDFIRYLKHRRWETDNRGNFIFCLDEWDINLPVFTLPDMEYSYSAHSYQIAASIESNKKKRSKQSDSSEKESMVELFKLVNSKLNVNMACLEIIVYATLVRDKDSYGLSRNSSTIQKDVSDAIIRNRSLGPAYTYEKQHMIITDPRSFFKGDRPDSVFDTFIAPQQVTKVYER